MRELMEQMRKGKKGMNDTEKEAKLGVLKFISDAADDAIAGKVKGLKKVTVASDSKEGLKKGLEMAEEKIGEKEEDDIEAVDGEAVPMEESEDEEEMLDKDEIEKKLAKLLKMKEKLENK